MTISIKHFTISLLFWILFSMHSIQAGMLSTQQIKQNSYTSDQHQLVIQTLQRDDVRNALIKHGVNPTHVEQRINQLTDQELQQLAESFDSLPAASGVGLVLFATGPIVLMLELMGYTDLTTTF